MAILRAAIIGAACAVLMLGSTAGAQQQGALLESRESLYNNIYVYRNGPYVDMTFGYNRNIYTESIYNPLDDRELPAEYTRYMTAGLMYTKKIDSVLEIGFGGGRTSWYLHRFLPHTKVTTVELDPDVIALAQKYFGIKNDPNFRIVNSDGRLFLMNSKEHFDLILIDAYRGPFVPFHLLTKEFYAIVKSHLASGGAVAQNIEPSTMLFDSAVKTLNSVFPQLDFYPAGGNAVMIAYDGAPLSAQALRGAADERQGELHLRYDLRGLLAARRPFDPHSGTIDANGKVLTDDFAPVETLKTIQEHNRKWPNKQ